MLEEKIIKPDWIDIMWNVLNRNESEIIIYSLLPKVNAWDMRKENIFGNYR